MKISGLLTSVASLLSLATTSYAIPLDGNANRHAHNFEERAVHQHHRHLHHARSTGGASISTGAGSGVRPTGAYPRYSMGNGTYYSYPTGSGTGYPYPTGSGRPFPTASSSGFPTSLVTSIASSSAESSTPTVTSTSSTLAATTPNASSLPFLRGVNVGSWLINEPWMEGGVFSGAFAQAVDQWNFDQIDGAAAQLQQHWSTWFTEADVQTLAGYGFNALRIPIGFWAYDSSDTPYLMGADAFLEQAIGWARSAGMYVWVDCHGSPGSQNGQQHSGHQGAIEWQQGDNLNRSTAVLQTMGAKYGAMEYADVVIGLEMVNEPSASGNNSYQVTQQWSIDAYNAVKPLVANPNFVISVHDSFVGPTAYNSIGSSLNGGLGDQGTFGIDVHEYSLYDDSDNSLTQPEHISQACGWGSSLSAAKQNMPIYVGEWSALTNICVLGDGSTIAGTSCSGIDNCVQCSTSDVSTWNSDLVGWGRKFVEAQLDTYEANTNGYFIWSWGGPGGWGVVNDINAGVFPNPVTSRQYASQC
ncbi:hypothetical protein MMC25_001829 [Agyrium rufum]|nr:hypothetical protein [Agyrium rufum]